MSTDAGPAITRYDFTRGALRGTHFTLYASCLIHRGEHHLETLPLAAIASLRVAYERDARRLGWGIALLIVALVLFAVSGPIAEFAGERAADMAKADANAVTRALQGLFGFLGAVAKALPFGGAFIGLAAIALGVLGWIGNTTLVLDFAGAERVYPVRGRNNGLLDFSEAVSERLMSLKR